MWQTWIAGETLGWVLAAWRTTLRNEIRGLDLLDRHPRAVIAVWHGRMQCPIFAVAHRGVLTMSSRSTDGEIACRAISRLGLMPARGSTGKGGLAAFEQIRRWLEDGRGGFVGLTVDGPKGPARRPKRGALEMARQLDLPLIPVSFSSRPFWRLKSWDRMIIAPPFARTVVEFGEPLRIVPGEPPAVARLRARPEDRRADPPARPRAARAVTVALGARPGASPLRFAAAAALTMAVLALLAISWKTGHEFCDRRLGFELSAAEDGLLVEGVAPGLGAHRAGIEPGDVLVEIGGQPVRSFVDYDHLAESFSPGREVPLTVIRDGHRSRLAVTPGAPFEWPMFALNAAPPLAYLALFLMALVQLGGDLRGRLLALFSASVAIELALPSGLPDGSLSELLASSVFLFMTGLELGLELHLASVIPRPASWLKSRARPVLVYYAIGLGFAVIGVLTEVSDATGAPLLPWDSDQLATVLDSILLPGWALAVVAILAIQVRSAVSARERHQALFVLLGVAPWAAFTLGSQIATWLGAELPATATEVVQPVALIAYPSAVFVAILRYRLFDFELVVRRSLVYTTVTLLLAAAGLGMLSFASGVVGQLTGNDRLPFWIATSVALAVGLLFAPLRTMVQHQVDSRLFPERVAMRKRLTDLAANLPALGNLPSMGRHLVSEIRDIFDVRSASLLVADPRTGVLVGLASTAVNLELHAERSFLLGPEDEGVRLLSRAGRVLPAGTVARHSAVLAQRFEFFNVEWAIALRSGDTLAGILLLGSTSDRGRFPAEARELLGLFSHTIASVLENVRLFESATFERLTGILRREAVLDLLEREARRAVRYRRPLTVGMADIDFFKRVNDRYGHLAGDAVLKLVAQAMSSGLRSSDSIGRYGGEEFLFVFPESDLAGAVRVAEKIRSAVESIALEVEHAPPIRVTISIGLAQLSDRHEGEHATRMLIAEADAALLRAKRSGRNRVEPAHALVPQRFGAIS